jgi:hypothetical protein
LKLIKSSIVIGLLLLFILFSFCHNISAGLFVNFSSNVYISWENVSGEPIIPIQEIKSYNLNLEYTVTGSPFGRRILYPLLYEDRRIDIQLSLEDFPDWAIIDVLPKTIPVNIPAIGDTIEYFASVQISLKEDAPAFETGIAEIKVIVPTMGHIQGFDQVISLPFKPAYCPLIDVSPQNSSVRIGQMDTATFTIDVNNLGNGITKCYFEIDKNTLPEGWTAEIDKDVIVKIGDNNKETVHMRVMPPSGLKKFEDIANIRVLITPVWAEDLSIRGATEILTLNVEVEPSTSNNQNELSIEIYLIIVGIIFLFLILFLFIRMKRRGSFMVEKDRKVFVDAIDLIISIFIIIAGIFLILFSLSWDSWINELSYLPDWMNNLTWIFFIVGSVTILFGIKKIFNDFLS